MVKYLFFIISESHHSCYNNVKLIFYERGVIIMLNVTWSPDLRNIVKAVKKHELNLASTGGMASLSVVEQNAIHKSISKATSTLGIGWPWF